jgi:hypothetical protein
MAQSPKVQRQLIILILLSLQQLYKQATMDRHPTTTLLLLLISSIITTHHLVSASNYCGTSWALAQTCTRPCPSGAPSQCFNGETCYSGTSCSPALLTDVPTRRPTRRPTPRPVNPLPYNNNNNFNNNAVNTNNVSSNNNNVNNNSPLYNAVATCGGGKVGNGLCRKINECCSTFGFCGTSDSHCENRAPVSGSAVGPSSSTTTGNTNANTSNNAVVETPTVKGTCGGGQIGNNICPNNSECCSQYGFCGTTLQHCVGKNTDNNNNSFNAQGIPVQHPQQQQGQVGGGGPTVITNGNMQFGGGHPEPLPPSTTNTIAHGTNKKIIGYYAGWQWSVVLF